MSASAPTDDDVIALFRKAAWEVDHKKFDRLDLDSKISDLGIDSVSMLEVIGFLEEEMEVHFPDERLARVETLRDLANLVSEISPALPASSTRSAYRA